MIGGTTHKGGLLHGASCIAFLGDDSIDCLVLAHAFEDGVVGPKLRSLRPGDLEVAGCFHSIPLAIGNDADEVALADDFCAFDMGDRCFIDDEWLCSDAKSALPMRQHHAPMQHARHAIMMHMGVFSGGFFRNVDARWPLTDKPISAWRFHRRGAVIFDIERLVAKHVAIGNLAEFAFATHRNNPVVDLETECLHAETGCCSGQKFLSGLRSSSPQSGGAAMNRRARTGCLLVRRDVCVETDRIYLMQAHIEFFGSNLQKPRLVTLTQLTLAGIDRRGVVCMDRDPGIDGVIIRRARLRAASGLRQRRCREAETDDHRTAAPEQAAAREGCDTIGYFVAGQGGCVIHHQPSFDILVAAA